MKFISYSVNDVSYIGVVKNNKIYKTRFNNIYELFDCDLTKIELEGLETRNIKEEPIIKYPKQDILCVGMNYLKHKEECVEAKLSKTREIKSVYFSKRCAEAITNGCDIDLHLDITNFPDYEGELGLIIKSDIYKARTQQEIKNKIFGYIIVNDVSARDLQSAHEQFYLGKSLETYTVLSSVLVTQDEFESFPRLNIKTYVNNELRQDDNTKNMIFDIEYLVKELSSGIVLKAGTIISTGTANGVGKALGKPLKVNDIVRVEIEKIGYIENRCK